MDHYQSRFIWLKFGRMEFCFFFAPSVSPSERGSTLQERALWLRVVPVKKISGIHYCPGLQGWDL